MRHAPVWFDRFPKSRRPSFPRLRGAHETRVAIVGGGLTGVSCALTLAASGIPAVLLEADAIGTGLASGTAGVLRDGFAGSFREAAAQHGLRTSRAVWDGLRRGSLDFAAALRRYRIRCGLEPSDLLTLAPKSDAESRSLKREYETRHEAGVDGSWLSASAVSRTAAVDSAGAVRTPAFVCDAYRACLGLAAAAVSRGAVIHEGSAATRIRSVGQGIEVSTSSGLVRAEWIIVATAAPIPDLRGLRRHLKPEHVYGVMTEPLSSQMRKEVGKRDAVLEDTRFGHRYVRWLPDDAVLLTGGRQPAVPERRRPAALVQRTGQLMYEFLLLYPEIAGLRPVTAWDRLDYETVDGLPFIGPHRNYPRHFFAFGSSRHGEGPAWTAARMALRWINGESSRADDAFSFHRIL